MGRDYDNRSNYNRRNDRGGHGGDRGGRRDGGQRRRGTPLSELDPKLTELSRRLIGAAIEVHKELGPGYSRDIYLKALELEMGDEEISYTKNQTFDVLFGDDVIGTVSCDLYVSDRFLVQVMAEQREVRPHERTALRADLRAADLELGLIINFGERRLKDGLVRVLNPDKLNELHGHRDESDDESEDEYDDEGEDGDEYEDDDDETDGDE
jgi:GxxExxY protein